MRDLIVRGFALSLFTAFLSGAACETELERGTVGSACTRARDCSAELSCVAGECRAQDANVVDAAPVDAAADAQAD